MSENVTGSLADELLKVIDEASAEFRGLGGEMVSMKPAPGVWSIKEILGHLIDSAANNHQRFVRALEVPALTFPGYEQDHWVASQDCQGRPWDDLVEFWAAYNRHLSHVIRRIPEADLETACRIGTSAAVPLRFLLEDYLVHLRHHLDQIRERRC